MELLHPHSVLCLLTVLPFFSLILASPSPFVPADSILINCGATSAVSMPDGRTFKTDPQSSPFISASDDNLLSVPQTAGVPSPLYLSARVFTSRATYTFSLSRQGWHWVRLHFHPLNQTTAGNGQQFNLTSAIFSVTTDDVVLLHNYNLEGPADWALKEYLVIVDSDHLSLYFSPLRNSIAYINGIEIVTVPDTLVTDTATGIPIAQIKGLSAYAFQTMYRLNMGGPAITSSNDTLGRTWVNDMPFLKLKSSATNVTVPPTTVRFPDGMSDSIAPNWVYASAMKMADIDVAQANFNITWALEVDRSFGYLVRLHFCDIVSKALNNLYFNVYINGRMAISSLDLSTVTTGLATAYYKDFVVNASVASDAITIQIAPTSQDAGVSDALLNGAEIFKMSNSVGSLDGEFGVDGTRAEAADGAMSTGRKAVAAIGVMTMLGAFAGVGAVAVRWYRKPRDYEDAGKSSTSWLLPRHSSFMSSTSKTSISRKSGYSGASTVSLVGRRFSLGEIQEATHNFDDKAVIGVGGFGNVYLGELEDGTKVAVKRGNPHSEQGVNEFQTEIQMLSKLRHRHLVSLIGSCDENREMILVYEYMAKGPFRDHLYGKGLPHLSWKQRLEICIGSARGLHYLHTGTAQGIIHRDVKTTNILLDESLSAKVADFGLSKDGPGMGINHVSTAVKGSFGYLDPEYFRRQQLTDKSDVYSFGVVLLEALCARPALDPALPREQVNLAEWAVKCRRRGEVAGIVDPSIAGRINAESMAKFVEAAEKCLAEYGVDRPSMGDVLWNLEYALQLHDANPPPEQEADAAAEVEKNAGCGGSGGAASRLDDSSTTVTDDVFGQLVDMTGR